MVMYIFVGILPTQYPTKDPVQTMPQKSAVQYHESEQKQMSVLQVCIIQFN